MYTIRLPHELTEAKRKFTLLFWFRRLFQHLLPHWHAPIPVFTGGISKFSEMESWRKILIKRPISHGVNGWQVPGKILSSNMVFMSNWPILSQFSGGGDLNKMVYFSGGFPGFCKNFPGRKNLRKFCKKIEISTVFYKSFHSRKPRQNLGQIGEKFLWIYYIFLEFSLG